METRSGERSRPVICLMDGELSQTRRKSQSSPLTDAAWNSSRSMPREKLWDRKRELLPEGVVEVLDLWHVMDRLWDVRQSVLNRSAAGFTPHIISLAIRWAVKREFALNRTIWSLSMMSSG
ncbi:hypothetical protein GC176_25505 [bacterium]|nr:hypothetical protein [bacterium]